MDALAGKKYRVTAWVRAASAGSGTSAWMHLGDASDWYSGGDSEYVVPTTTWRQVSADITAGNNWRVGYGHDELRERSQLQCGRGAKVGFVWEWRFRG